MTPAELNESLDTLQSQFADLRLEVVDDPTALKAFFTAVEEIEARAAAGQDVVIWERVARILDAAGFNVSLAASKRSDEAP